MCRTWYITRRRSSGPLNASRLLAASTSFVTCFTSPRRRHAAGRGHQGPAAAAQDTAPTPSSAYWTSPTSCQPIATTFDMSSYNFSPTMNADARVPPLSCTGSYGTRHRVAGARSLQPLYQLPLLHLLTVQKLLRSTLLSKHSCTSKGVFIFVSPVTIGARN